MLGRFTGHYSPIQECVKLDANNSLSCKVPTSKHNCIIPASLLSSQTTTTSVDDDG